MRSRYRINTGNAHFITSTVVEWLPVFTTAACCDIVVRSFNYCRERGWLLNQLEYFCAAHKHASSHQVWQEGVHPQSITSDEMMLQKLEYLHNNPVKRGFVASPEHGVYSSAHEWLPGAIPTMRVDPWR